MFFCNYNEVLRFIRVTTTILIVFISSEEKLLIKIPTRNSFYFFLNLLHKDSFNPGRNDYSSSFTVISGGKKSTRLHATNAEDLKEKKKENRHEDTPVIFVK